MFTRLKGVKRITVRFGNAFIFFCREFCTCYPIRVRTSYVSKIHNTNTQYPYTRIIPTYIPKPRNPFQPASLLYEYGTSYRAKGFPNKKDSTMRFPLLYIPTYIHDISANNVSTAKIRGRSPYPLQYFCLFIMQTHIREYCADTSVLHT